MKPGFEHGALNYSWAATAIDQLVQSGVRYICAAPGFRNSPLLLAAHRDTRVAVVTVIDERGAGFCALGLAKRDRAPVAVLSTSGTACANFYPALLEARYSHTSLVVLTADRPQRLAGLGSNQTMDQIRLFGDHARFFANLDPPSGAAADFERLRYVLAKAVHLSQARVRGPVHVNIAFEEPLLPAGEADREVVGRPVTIPAASSLQPEAAALAEIRSMIEKARVPLFLLGPGNFSDTTLGNIVDLAEGMGAPLVAEAVTSLGFHRRWSEAKCLVANAEILGDATAIRDVDLIVRFGPPPVSKKADEILGASGVPVLLFDEMEEMRNPGLGAATYIDGGIAEWAKALAGAGFRAKPEAMKARDALAELEGARRRELRARLAGEKRLTEWHAMERLIAQTPEDATIVIGNSMPVRDFCAVAERSARRLRVVHNRGLSGIDGLVAAACGVALDSPAPVLLILGDLSLIHDINSLAIARNFSERINLKIVVMNNHGGEIFRKLATKRFDENWFTTPQSVDFLFAAGAFGLPYAKVEDVSELEEITRELFLRSGPRLVEIRPDREANMAIRF